MRSVSVTMSVSLDGVVQGLGRPDEDTRNGFPHGGWGQRYQDEVLGREMSNGMARPGDLLLGRRYPGLVVALNRAVAVAEIDGPAQALALVEALRMRDYHLLPAIRAELLTRLGRHAETRKAYDPPRHE